MILLALVPLALVFSLIFGGKLRQLAQAQIAYSPLILLVLGAQVAIFSSWWQDSIGHIAWLTASLYSLSMLLLLIVIWYNRRLPGIVILGVGLLLNATVILANGGHMPASLAALKLAGIAETRTAFEALHANNSGLISEGTPLWFLGDVFAVPRQWPLANIFSVGDVLIAAGAAWFVWANMRIQRPQCLRETSIHA
jgi:hypothetical protein